VAIAKIPVSAIPRAKTLHDTTGTWKAVVDADTDLILGAALLGHNAGEVISTLQIAMLGGLRTSRSATLCSPIPPWEKASTCSLMHSMISSRLMAKRLQPRYQAGDRRFGGVRCASYK
jgi:pyruvate/2-oxoglutarate dehydrogenase complex dihydrolipoamide dehydrogenase (E3) component